MPYGENIKVPLQSVNPSAGQDATLPIEPNVSAPTVVLPGNGGIVPKWFYFIFGITIIVFLLVTALLVLQITQKTPNPAVIPTIVPTKAASNNILPTVTQTATDSGTDDIASIDADLKSAELVVLDKGLDGVEKQL